MEAEDKNKKENSDIADITFEEDAENTTEGLAQDPKKIIAKLRERLKATEALKQEYLLGWQKAKADYINTRKKDEETNREFAKFAKSDLVLELISVLDSFDMAFGDKAAWEKLPTEWRSGIERICSQLLSVLKANGLSEVYPEGEQFDPARMEAIVVVEAKNESEDDRVFQVLQKGYFLHDKLIRTAKVKVGKYAPEKNV